MGHPQFFYTPRETRAGPSLFVQYTYREGEGASKEGEVKQADAGGQEESGGLFVLVLRNEDAFDIPLNVSTLNSDIWIGCTE